MLRSELSAGSQKEKSIPSPYLRRRKSSNAEVPEATNAKSDGSGTRSVGLGPSPTRKAGNVGGIAFGSPVVTEKTVEFPHELGRPDAWAWAKVAPAVVSQ